MLNCFSKTNKRALLHSLSKQAWHSLLCSSWLVQWDCGVLNRWLRSYAINNTKVYIVMTCNLLPLYISLARQVRETDHSPSSRAGVKNGGAIPPLPHTSSGRGAWLIKHRDNFSFTLILIEIQFPRAKSYSYYSSVWQFHLGYCHVERFSPPRSCTDVGSMQFSFLVTNFTFVCIMVLTGLFCCKQALLCSLRVYCGTTINMYELFMRFHNADKSHLWLN
jgi:hypothetical protein